jgi:polygalacturonase
MAKAKRTITDKLHTLLFWKDTRVTEGEPYTEVRKYDFSSYYPEDDYIHDTELPEKNVFDIRFFGAVANDVDVDNALYINMAFEAAEKVGGTVLISGGDYTSTTVFLKSGVTLFIERGSSITANETGKGYQNRALVYGENLENITLTGGGKIKGNGHLFGRKPVYDENIAESADYIDVIEMRQEYRKQLRFAHPSKYGSPIILVNCNNIKAHNFIIENSAYWSFRLDKCSNVEIKDFIINNNRHVANADGFDMVGSSNVLIEHCFVSTADDGVVIKNAVWEGCDSEMCNIAVRNCEIISCTNAVKVGTETTHDINGITVENCRLFMTDLYPGSVSAISLEAVDGAKLSHVTIKNIEADRCSCPLFIRLGNRNRAAEITAQSARAIEFGEKAEKGELADKNLYNMKSEIHDVAVENLSAKEVEIPIMICGFRQKGITKRVKNISLKNINLELSRVPDTVDRRLFIPEYATEYPECNRFRNLPSYALFIRHAENVLIENFCCSKKDTWKKERYIKDLIYD